MGVIQISSCRDVRAAIRYVNGKNKERVAESFALNCDSDRVISDMKNVIKMHNKENNIQAYRIIQSFSEDEFDSENEEDVKRANEIGVKFAEKAFPNRLVYVVTHTDGEGKKVHNHIIVCSIEPVAGKSMRAEQTRWVNLKKINDEVLLENELHVVKADKQVRSTSKEDKMRNEKKYVWKDDMRNQILDVLSDEKIQTKDDFKKAIDEKFENKKGCNFRGKGVSYSFVDKDNKKRTARASKLGKLFEVESIENILMMNQQKERLKEIERLKNEDLEKEEEIENKEIEIKDEQVIFEKVEKVETSEIKFSENVKKEVYDKKEKTNDEIAQELADEIGKNGLAQLIRKNTIRQSRTKSKNREFE